MRFVARGFGLIETVVAISVTAMALMVIVALIPSTYLVGSRGRYRMEANQLAQSVLERVRARPFQELVVDTSTALANVTVAQSGIVLQPKLSVERVAGISENDIKKVRVEVSFEYRGRQEKVVHELQILHLRR